MGGRPGSYGAVDFYARVSEYKQWSDKTREDAAGKAPRGSDVVDVTQGSPEGERGKLLAAFFESLGEEEPLLAIAPRPQ